MGAPGSGKGTQARLLEEQLGFIHVDTGKLLEKIVHDPRLQNDPVIQARKKEWESGLLNDPRWTLQKITASLETYGKANLDVVFSGSPRTMFEAVGGGDELGFLDILAKYYSPRDTFVFRLDVRPDESLHRNSNRLLCSMCGIQYMSLPHVTLSDVCPFCGGALRRRVLDQPDVIMVRLQEYVTRTGPIFEELTKRGYRIRDIHGERLPYEVHEDITHQITG